MKPYKVISIWESLTFLIALLLSLSFLLFYLKGMGSSFTHKGIKSLHKKDFTAAQKLFTQALIKKPFNPWFYMNLALIHDLLKAPDKALKHYNIVSSHLVKQSNLAAFFSYFNKGELHGRLGPLEKALENYQKALEFQHKEKEIKKNIELLFTDDQQSQKNNKEEQQEKNQPENEEKQKNKDQQNTGGNFKNTEKSFNEKKQQPQSGNKELKPEDKNNKEKNLKGLSEKEQKAILEEIEKQENKVRTRFYQRKKVFGDKTTEDW